MHSRTARHCIAALLIAFGLLSSKAVAQDQPSHLSELVSRALVDKGFENVSVAEDPGRVVATFENRIYRYDARGMQEAIKAITPLLEDTFQLILIPRRKGIRLGAVSVPVRSYYAFKRGEISKDVFISSIEVSLDLPNNTELGRSGKANKTAFRTDVLVRPQFVAEFGNFDDPVESQINLVPEVSLFLWQGASLTAQLILPIQNELAEQGNYVRPGLLTMNQTVRAPGNIFASMTLGYFTRNRYGLDSEARAYAFNGRLAAGIRAGYTGYLSYEAGEWLYGDLDALTYSADIAYQVLPQYNFTLRGTYAKFLFGDTGWRLDAHRSFGEVEIGLFGMLADTRASSNAGVRITIPLPFSKHAKPARLRARTAEQFQWEYRYRNLPLEGKQYASGGALSDFWGHLTPTFLKNRLAKLENW
ncbi:MAG TPA: YjbH domain-containing protein [Rhodothermales bacterium]|nr:YjbH domain-containing protein [Rhodothermales bacterium]